MHAGARGHVDQQRQGGCKAQKPCDAYAGASERQMTFGRLMVWPRTKREKPVVVVVGEAAACLLLREKDTLLWMRKKQAGERKDVDLLLLLVAVAVDVAVDLVVVAAAHEVKVAQACDTKAGSWARCLEPQCFGCLTAEALLHWSQQWKDSQCCFAPAT